LVPIDQKNDLLAKKLFPEFSSTQFLKSYRPTAESTADAETISTASQWIKACQRDHDCSKDVAKSQIPKRLIDLSGRVPRLLVTENEKLDGGYATLSHSWGPNPSFFTLKASNLEIMRMEIPVQLLSQNFQDAITITRKLGLKYLWIDSLCILQSGDGSEADWLEHSITMLSIYANCEVNIAISHASKPEGGCFRTRDPATIQPIIVEWHEFLDDTSNLYLILNFNFIDSNPTAQPLAERAWVFQERLLSPRVLSFGPERVFFECRVGLACEQYPGGIPRSALTEDSELISIQSASSEEGKRFVRAKFLPNFTIGNYAALIRVSSGNEKYQPFSVQQLIDTDGKEGAWIRILKNYTACNLSFPEKDKLVALGGIAKIMADIRKEEYLAGFFKSDLPRTLVWSSRSGTKSYDRGPSWSWATMNGPLNWLDVSEDVQILARIVNVGINPLHANNPFGQIQGGVLTLCARYICYQKGISGRYTSESVSLEKGDAKLTFFMDEEVSEDNSTCDRILVPIISRGYRENGGHHMEGIVLKSSGLSFQRIGIWLGYDRSLHDAWGALKHKHFDII